MLPRHISIIVIKHIRVYNGKISSNCPNEVGKLEALL